MASLSPRCYVRAFSSCGKWGLFQLRCAGFSLQWLLLQSRISGAWAQYLWLMCLVALQHVQSSWSRDQTCVAFTGSWILNHWTTKEVKGTCKAKIGLGLKWLYSYKGECWNCKVAASRYFKQSSVLLNWTCLHSPTFFWLVGNKLTRQCFRNLHQQPSGSREAQVNALVVNI